MPEASEFIGSLKLIQWIKAVFQKAQVSDEETQVVLPCFASFYYSELKYLILSGLNCILFTEEENILYLIKEVQKTRLQLVSANTDMVFHQYYESFIDFLLEFFREGESIKKAIKGHLFLVPLNDHGLVAALLFLLERCLELALIHSDQELDEIIETGMRIFETK